MSQGLSQILVAVSRSPELSILVKATLALAIGLAAARAARRARASTRHAILAATFAALLALPIVAWSAPGIAIRVPAVPASSRPSASLAPSAQNAAASPANRAAVAAPGSAPVTIAAARPSWSAIARGVWALGALLLVSSLAVAAWRFDRLRRRGLPWPGSRARIADLAARAGVRREIDVLLHEELPAPATCGWRRPAILLPADAEAWPRADVDRAFVHEIEHVRRGDWIVHVTARATCALFWFHPLVWIAFRQLALEAERACDDAVVDASERTDYADQLVALARRLSRAAQPTLSMANRGDLAARVSAILDGSRSRGRVGLVTVSLLAAAAAILVAAVAPLRAVADVADRAAATPETRGVAAAEGGAGTAGAARQRAQRPRAAAALSRALMEAAEDGDLDGMAELAAAGANVNGVLAGDGSPLIGAARGGSVAAVRFLLDRGADPNLVVEGDGSPLIAAAATGRGEIVELLLSRGAAIDQVAEGDENALIQAAGNGQLAVVKLLVAKGADVNARVRAETWSTAGPRTEWRTPLGMARRGRHAALVAYLESVGARE